MAGMPYLTLPAVKKAAEAKRQEAIRRAVAANQMLSSGPQMPPPKVVKGSGGQPDIYVAPHWTEQLNAAIQPMAAQLQARMAEKEAGEAETDYATQEATAAREHMARMPTARPEEQLPPNVMGPPQPGQQPSQADIVRWAQEGQNIPSLRDTLSALMSDQLIKAPEREENRAWRSEEAAANRAAREEQAKADREHRAQLADWQRGVQLAGIEQRAQAAKDANETRQFIAGLVNARAGTPQSKAEAAYEQSKAREEGKQAAAQGAQAGRSQDIAESIPQITTLLDSATGSGVGSLVDKAGALVGYSTEGAKANAKLKPLVHNVLMAVQRFEGPQSDKDVAAYREAGGALADDTLPIETRKAAASTILQLHEGLQRKYGHLQRGRTGGGASGEWGAAKGAPTDDDLMRKYLPK
jgi:hypothetical protein